MPSRLARFLCTAVSMALYLEDHIVRLDDASSRAIDCEEKLDFGTVALFFAIGLGLALLARSFTVGQRGGKGIEGLPLKDGSVRIDRMVARHDAAEGEVAVKSQSAASPEAAAPPVTGTTGAGKVRSRRRKR